MEEIKGYINHFFNKTKKNIKYSLRSNEMSIFMNAMLNLKDANKAFETVVTLFDYGYAKGYRAALSEMKKGGASV